MLVLDLREHDEDWVRDRLGDRWLGFSEEKLRALLADAGLTDVKVTVGARRTGDPFTVSDRERREADDDGTRSGP